MQLAIEISEEDYNWIKQAPKGITHYPYTLKAYDAIKNGTPLGEKYEDVAKAFQFGLAFGFGEKYDEMDKVINTINKTLWIPVNERLPEVGKEVLVCYSSGEVEMAYYYFARENADSDETGWYDAYRDVQYFEPMPIAWMPLPKPYKVERSGEE